MSAQKNSKVAGIIREEARTGHAVSTFRKTQKEGHAIICVILLQDRRWGFLDILAIHLATKEIFKITRPGPSTAGIATLWHGDREGDTGVQGKNYSVG